VLKATNSLSGKKKILQLLGKHGNDIASPAADADYLYPHPLSRGFNVLVVSLLSKTTFFFIVF
jgi:hypothetical protein